MGNSSILSKSRKLNKSNLEKGFLEDIPAFHPALEERKWWMSMHYLTGNFICGLIVFSFVIAMLFSIPLKDSIIGIVGSIVGYYIAKAPYELK